MRRRRFLRKIMAASSTAVFTAATPFVRTSDKAQSRSAIVGEGAYRYECVHNWGQLPDSISWQTTHGVAIDSAGLVYITHMGLGNNVMDTVVVFDAKGKFVRSFGKQWHRGGHGIDIRREGSEEFLYLCHMTEKGPVVKTTLKGEVVWQKETPEESGFYSDKDKYRPTNIAFAPDGGFYVGDGYGSHYIHQYDAKGNWVRTWGGVGDGPGKMKTPHGLWFDDRPGREPSLVVADRANARLQYFTLDGQHIGFVRDLLFPAHFDIRGDVLLVPDLHARVSLFDRENKPVVHLGDDPDWRKTVLDGFKVRTNEAAWQPGKFVHPHDACFDKQGNIFVIEWVQTGRVSWLRHVS